MRPLHSKRKRTSLQDAHLFIKNGVGGGTKDSDYISDYDRENIVNEVTYDLINIVKRNFPKTTNLEYAILKTHLIVEYALTQFIRCSVYVLVESESINFTFIQKLEIAILLGLGHGDPTFVPTLELINRLRNQVAHKFNFSIESVDDIIRINLGEVTIQLNNKQRISYLKSICVSICYRIIGNIEARVSLTSGK